ncbi:MAG: hypothetical protein IV093_21660 [Rubrivivax sp.]|nr:hypothetical protein [Rubrivivax sp.]
MSARTTGPSAGGIAAALSMAVLAAVPWPSRASTYAEASLSVSQFALFDLDPDDGITPWVRFDGGGTVVYLQAGVAGQILQTVLVEGAYQDVAAASDWGAVNQAWASAVHGEATGTPGSMTLRAGVSAGDFRSDSQLTQLFASATPTDYQGSFTLSPKTYMDFNVHWDARFGARAQPSAATYEVAAYSVIVQTYMPNGYVYDRTVERRGSDRSDPGDGGWDYTSMGSEYFGFKNHSFSEVTGALDFRVEAWGETASSMVPEPSAAQLWPLGLGLLSLARRTRRSEPTTEGSR